jgi:hypothetical protein
LRKEDVETHALLDSGAGGTFIDQNYVRKLQLETQLLTTPVKARNVDGTENKRGTIKSYVDLQIKIGDRLFDEHFYVTGLGKQKIILGFPWLKKHNPMINWQTGLILWEEEHLDKTEYPKPSITDEDDEEEWMNRTINALDEQETDTDHELVISYIEEIKQWDNIWVNKTNLATELAIKENEKKADLTPKELVPKDLHEFLDVFDEEKANRFPESNIWDHKIDLKEGFEPKSFKNYNLTPAEQIELDKFLKENLEKGYIRPSQSPMASPFFFVNKKDGKLRPCQDYRYLNKIIDILTKELSRMPIHYP